MFRAFPEFYNNLILILKFCTAVKLLKKKIKKAVLGFFWKILTIKSQQELPFKLSRFGAKDAFRKFQGLSDENECGKIIAKGEPFRWWRGVEASPKFAPSLVGTSLLG